MIVGQLHNRFVQQFNTPPVLARAPGRINLLGEHTDYNEGFVLPGAIGQAAYVAVSMRNDDTVILQSMEFDERLEVQVAALKPVNGWPDYVLGVVDQLLKRGYPVRGFNLVLTSNVPVGAGLSSSAAVECAVAVALDRLFNLKIERIDLAKMAQQAEHEYAGTRCGIMDQFASLYGKENHAILLDCRSLLHDYILFDFPGVEIVLFDTGVKHALASSEYNTRRSECEEGVQLIKRKYPVIKSLRDVTQVMIKDSIPRNTAIYNRCKYVVEENERLIAACDDLAKRDIHAFGKKMFQTHNGLSGLYQVSCPELDFLVNRVRNNPFVFGARLMGGGFGGCTINLVNRVHADEIIRNEADAYAQKFGKALTVHRVQLSDGAGVIDA